MRFIEANEAKYLDIKKSPSFEGLGGKQHYLDFCCKSLIKAFTPPGLFLM